MAGGHRPPSLDYDLLVLGGRPKAAIADERLLVVHSFSRPVASSDLYQAASDIATIAIESRMPLLYLIGHKHKISI